MLKPYKERYSFE
jgi:SET domain-containing protein